MSPPYDEGALEEEAQRKRLEAVKKAFELLEQNPDFPSARVRLHDRELDVERSGIPNGPQERMSEARFEYCIRLFDIECEEYLRLVVDLESHRAYATIIDELIRRIFFHFSGLPIETIPPTSPFMKAPLPDPLVHRDKLLRRAQYWVIEGHRRLAALRAPPSKKSAKSQRKTLEPRPDLLTNLDANINRLKAAQVLGITPRTIDRWVVDGKLTPVGPGTRKRFKGKDLKKILDQKHLDNRDTR